MSEVFYRKWRPRRLDQVVGQRQVTQTLRQAVSLGRVAHAYLFCGPRGTGKTSTARILAKAVNCLSPQGGEPDNECEMCRSINEGRALDLIEIDAASNRGIDDIRNLSDKIHFSPNQARYKVYIIDEVHMLTEHAFNALLKTLEEPPPHAIFVLATTEAQKVPLTVISRCQRFDFRRVPIELITDKLAELCKGEEVEVTTEALILIARNATGSLRDAENLLEQVVVSYDSPITEDQVRDLLELGGDEVALDLVSSVISRSVSDGLKVINDVAGQGNDLRRLHRGVVEYLRAALLLKSNTPTPLGYAEETMVKLKSLADAASIEYLVHALKTFARVDLRRDSSSPLPLELALVESSTEVPSQADIKGASVPPTRDNQTLHTRPAQNSPERRPPEPVQSRPAVAPASTASSRSDSPGNTASVAQTEPEAKIESQWNTIIRSLRHTGKRFKLGPLLRGCKEREIADGLITLRFLYKSHVERMEEEIADPATHRELQEVLARVMGSEYDVRVSLVDSVDNGRGQGVAQRSHLVRAAQAMGARVVEEKEIEA